VGIWREISHGRGIVMQTVQRTLGNASASVHLRTIQAWIHDSTSHSDRVLWLCGTLVSEFRQLRKGAGMQLRQAAVGVSQMAALDTDMCRYVDV